MRSGNLSVVALVGWVWAATGHADSVSIRPENDAYSPRENKNQESRPIDPKTAIANWSQIGLLSKGTEECPTVSGWKVESLVSRALSSASCGPEALTSQGPSEAALREELADLALLRKLGLDRVCLYQAKDASILPFQKPAGLLSVKPDRMALSPAAEPAGSLGSLALGSSGILSAHFLEHTGSFSVSGERVRFQGKPKVRLVFLDTEPTHEGVPAPPEGAAPGRSFHGYTLAHLANQLVCGGDEGACAAEIATRLAMPYRDFESDQLPEGRFGPNSEGGNLGLTGDLATAILEEVWQWRRDRRPDRPQHLVLNLSLGWDGELFGDLEAKKVSKLEPGAKAVYLALKAARKLGVLVIAAAGNQRGGPVKPTSPLFPAVWELRRPSWLSLLLGRKPIYAVGGVDWQGLPVANVRTKGMPQRTAYADHAVTNTEAGSNESPTLILTGTSVGAAVTSAIAAAVWHLRPELGPGGVMKLVGRSGEDLEVPADFYAWQRSWLLRKILGPPPLRQVSLCRAVALAQGQGSEVLSCPPWRREPPLLGHAADSPLVVFRERSPNDFAPPCTAGRRLLVPGGRDPIDTCPAERFGDIGSQRWVFPQPPNNPCMGCSLVPGGKKGVAATAEGSPLYTLQMELNREWQDGDAALEIEAATLEIVRFERGARESLTTHVVDADVLGAFKAGRPAQLTGLAVGGSLYGCTARLDFRVRRGDEVTSIINPVIVDP